MQYIQISLLIFGILQNKFSSFDPIDIIDLGVCHILSIEIMYETGGIQILGDKFEVINFLVGFDPHDLA